MLIPAFWTCMFDFLITVFHQPSEYWNGNLEMFNEDNPIVANLMRNHISGIFIFTTVWLTLIGLIGCLLPPKLLRIFSLFVVIAHSWGASSWIAYYYSFWLVLVFVLLNSTIFIFVQDIYVRSNNRNTRTELDRKL